MMRQARVAVVVGAVVVAFSGSLAHALLHPVSEYVSLTSIPPGLGDVGSKNAIAVGDLDGDGDLDVIAANSNGDFFF